MKIYGIIGIALLLIFVVKWIERGAVERFEFHNLVHALGVKDHSLADVQERSEKATSDQETELADARRTIEALRAEADVLRAQADEVPEADEYCKPGCKLRWRGEELESSQSP